MTLTLELPAQIQRRLIDEATCRGISVEDCVVKVLDRCLPDAGPPFTDYGDDTREYLISDAGVSRYDLILMDLHELEAFAESLQRFIDVEDDRLMSKYTGPPEEYEGWWLQDVLASRLRATCLSAVMDMAATHLSYFCRDIGVVQRVSVPDLQRDTFNAARRFLCRTILFRLPEENDWQDMGDLYALRNRVAHALGTLPEEVNEYRRFELLAKRQEGISVSERIVDFDRKFCASLLVRVQSFFKVLHEEYVRVCREAQS